MIRLFVWLILIIVGLALVIFAATNRHWTQIDLWPTELGLRVPAVGLLFAGLAIGFIVGLFVSWLAGGRVRRQTKRQRREIKRLTARLEQTPPGAAKVPAAAGPPARTG